MPLLLMLWCNVVKRNWTIILMQRYYFFSRPYMVRYNLELIFVNCSINQTLTMKRFFNTVLFFLLLSLNSLHLQAQHPRRTKDTIKTTAECKFCKETIEKSLSKVKGIRKVTCDYQKHEVYVVYNSKRTNINDIRKVLTDLGYDADDMKANNVKTKQIQHSKTP